MDSNPHDRLVEVKFDKWLWIGLGLNTDYGRIELAIYLPFTLISILLKK